MPYLFIKFIVILSMLIAPAAYGDNSNATSDSDSIQSLIDMKFFSLSKNEQNAFDLPAAVYTITQEDIRRSGATNIPDLLRMAPGLQVMQIGGNTWAIGSRGFNFQFTNKLLVMIDGRTVYTPQFSGVFWDIQDVIFEDIEKIEIIRGPGATVWGSNAVNGIINIITKNAYNTVGNYSQSFISNNLDRAFSARMGKKTQKGYFRIYAKSTNSQGEKRLLGSDAHDGIKHNKSGFRYDYKKEQSNLTIQGDFRSGVTKNYFNSFPQTTAPFAYYSPRDKDTIGSNIILKHSTKFSNKYKIINKLYYDYDHYNIHGVLKRNSHTIDLDTQHFFQLDDKNELTLGLGYRLTDSKLSFSNNGIDYRRPKLRLPIYSAFVQNRHALIKDKTFITIGTKIEHHYFSNLDFEPSAKIEYFPKDNQTLWAAVTRAIRTPSRGEDSLTLRYFGTTAGYAAIAYGTDYDSEKLIAYEAGHRIELSDNILLETTVFFNQYNNLRTFESNNLAPYNDVISPASADNNGFGESYGTEINSTWQINPKWRIKSSYSFLTIDLHIKDYSQDTSPLRLENSENSSPKNQFKFMSFYNITSDIEFDSMLYFVDNLKTGIKNYTRLDSRIGWRPKNNIELSFIGQNLLDNRHQEFGQGTYSFAKEISRKFIVKFSCEF